jgi:hypothetical protein
MAAADMHALCPSSGAWRTRNGLAVRAAVAGSGEAKLLGYYGRVLPLLPGGEGSEFPERGHNSGGRAQNLARTPRCLQSSCRRYLPHVCKYSSYPTNFVLPRSLLLILEKLRSRCRKRQAPSLASRERQAGCRRPRLRSACRLAITSDADQGGQPTAQLQPVACS